MNKGDTYKWADKCLKRLGEDGPSLLFIFQKEFNTYAGEGSTFIRTNGHRSELFDVPKKMLDEWLKGGDFVKCDDVDVAKVLLLS
jgi:hypothetical protein